MSQPTLRAPREIANLTLSSFGSKEKAIEVLERDIRRWDSVREKEIGVRPAIPKSSDKSEVHALFKEYERRAKKYDDAVANLESAIAHLKTDKEASDAAEV